MRLIGNVLFYLLLTLSLGYLVKDSILQLFTEANTPYIIPNNIDTDISRTYLLSKNKSLHFKLSQAPKKVWLASTARLQEPEVSSLVANYKLQIDFLDSHEQVIYSHLHNTQTDSELDILIEEQVIPQRFFETIDYKASKSRSIYFSKDKYLEATTVRVSLFELSDNVKDVAISLYQRQLRDSKLDPLVTWERMSINEKNSKAKLHALSADFINVGEQHDYAQYRWDPIAPNGIPGVNLQQMNLYKISKQNGFWPTILWNNQVENLADNFKAVTFAVHQPEEVTFSLSHTYKENKNFQVTVKWYPPFAGMPQVKKYNFSTQSNLIKQVFGRGLVEISSTIPVDVSPIEYKEAAFPNEKHFLSTYLINHSQSIDFEVDNINQELLPIRIDIRQYNMLHQLSHDKPFSVNYQWINKQGKVIKSGNIATNLTPDIYQQVVSNESYDQVSMPSSKYFILPAEVTKIRLNSTKEVLASVSLSFDSINHSKSLPAQVRNWFDYSNNVKYWHELKPLNWQNLEQIGHRFPIKLYHKPVFIAPEIISGDFQSNSVPTLVDEFVWRDLMTPFIRNNGVTDANTHFTFSRLKNNSRHLRLVDKDKEYSPPTLFFVRESSQPQTVNLNINNELIKPSTIINKWGKINLMNKADSYLANFKGNDIKWYLNQQKVQKDSYITRRGIQIESETPVIFNVNKTTNQTTLLLRFFSLDSEYAELGISIKAATISGVYEELTQKEQRFKLSPTEKKQGFTMQSNHRIGQEYKMTLQLLSDLPKGEYSIEVQLLTKSSGFIALNEITTEPISSLKTFKGVEKTHD